MTENEILDVRPALPHPQLPSDLGSLAKVIGVSL